MEVVWFATFHQPEKVQALIKANYTHTRSKWCGQNIY